MEVSKVNTAVAWVPTESLTLESSSKVHVPDGLNEHLFSDFGVWLVNNEAGSAWAGRTAALLVTREALLNRILELSGGGESLDSVSGDGPAQDFPQLGGENGVEVMKAAGIGCKDGVHEGVRIARLFGIRQPLSEQLEEDDAQRVNVGAKIETRRWEQLFWRHVRQRAGSGVRRIRSPRVKSASQAEVQHHGLATRVHEDIRRLEIEMENAMGVRSLDGFAQPGQESKFVLNGSAAGGFI